ncbi:hypothetical protein ACHQM5_017562 [Ranunculus cassubicifolius]
MSPGKANPFPSATPAPFSKPIRANPFHPPNPYKKSFDLFYFFISIVSTLLFGSLIPSLLQQILKFAIFSSEFEFSVNYSLLQFKLEVKESIILDKRTVRLVSGAKLIFSAPKVQWLQVFERLQDLNADQEDFLEMMHFVTVSHRFVSIPNQYQELQNLPQGKSQSLHTEQEDGILEYLTVLLSNQLHILWKLSPILAAMAIPSWLPLFRLYTIEIEKQFIGDSPTISCCSCIQDEKKHVDCELGERIWCLYVFHIQGSPNSLNNTNKS